jgi:amphiphysin
LQEFQVADTHIRETLPPIIAAAFSILPHLLAAQILTQNTVLAQYYTVLHNYCEENGFQSPPPPMEEVIAHWGREFAPIKKEAETMSMIARGKAVHAPMQLGDDPSRRGSSMTHLGIRNHINTRRGGAKYQVAPATSSPSMRPEQPRIGRIPSTNSIPQITSSTQNFDEEEVKPYHLTPYLSAQTPAEPAGGFNHNNQVAGGSTQSSMLSTGSSAIGKKKPPPPPPKRLPSTVWVTAIYDFSGQEAGDLTFREGDRIKVVKQTESGDDWWEGDLRGKRGKFPANYCELA